MDNLETSNTGTSEVSDNVVAQEANVIGESSDNNAKTEKFDRSVRGIRDNIGEALDKAMDTNPELNVISKSVSIDDIKDANLPAGDHKGIDYNKVMEDLPADAQKLLANIRKSYTQKTQELSKMKNDLQSQMAAFQNQETMDKFEQLSQRNTELDPYDTRSFENRIEEEVARRMQAMMKPMQEQYQLQQRKAKLDSWTAQNPDYTDYKTEIVGLLKGNKSLDLQSAYYIAKGKAKTAKAKELEAEVARYKEAARNYGLKVSAGNTITGKKPPTGLSSYDLYKWVRAQKEGK